MRMVASSSRGIDRGCKLIYHQKNRTLTINSWRKPKEEEYVTADKVDADGGELKHWGS